MTLSPDRKRHEVTSGLYLNLEHLGGEKIGDSEACLKLINVCTYYVIFWSKNTYFLNQFSTSFEYWAQNILVLRFTCKVYCRTISWVCLQNICQVFQLKDDTNSVRIDHFCQLATSKYIIIWKKFYVNIGCGISIPGTQN